MEAIEQLKHHPDRCLRLLVRIERNLPRRTLHISHRNPAAELAAPCLRPLARQHARLENVQLRFRHRALEAKQETIVEVGRIIYSIGVGDQGVEQRADLQQLMPVPA